MTKFITPDRVRSVDWEAVMHLVEDEYGYTHNTLLKRSNQHHISHPRHLVFYLLVEMGVPGARVARYFKKHHTTVLHSRAFVAKQMKQDASVRDLVSSLSAAIEANRDRFTKPIPRRSIIKRPAQPPPEPLPDVATGTIAGMEELDKLILAGRGDKPRKRISEVVRRPVASTPSSGSAGDARGFGDRR